MSRRKIADEQTDTVSPLIEDEATNTEDTEGHSIGLLLGMMALEEADRASKRERDMHRQAAALKPITKSFPNLRHAAMAEAQAENARTEDVGAGAMAPGALPEPSTS